MALSYPDKLSLAQLPTPLQPLDRLSEQLGGPRIWLKRDDLTDCALSGNKIRKLEYTLAAARSQQCDTVITCGGIQSNHCRATALLAARLGMRCHLVLRGDKPDQLTGNTLLDGLAGAKIHFIPRARYQREHNQIMQTLAEELQTSGSKAWVIPTGASDGVGIWGYIHCAGELQQDFQRLAIAPGYIVHATGSGGTQAGLTLGAHLHQLASQVIGINVCDDEAYFQRKVREDIADWQSRYQQALDIETLAIQVIDGYVGKGYAIASDEVLKTIRHVASLEGVVFDPVYSGKAFHGLLREIEQGRFADTEDIVFIHTGGIFGLYAYQQDLSFLIERE